MTSDELQKIFSNPEAREQLKQLVLERMQVLPDTMGIAIGQEELTKQDVVRHVECEDEIGKQMMAMQLDFLRDLASGAMYDEA